MPIVTATATTSPKSAHMSQHNTSPLQVSVNSNNYMNKVLAAMCLTQQQQQQQPSNSNANAQLSSLVAAGLLDQSSNSPLSGLALALAGKNPLKASQLNAAANILEHGEQKASLNEQASADNTTTSPNQLTIQALQQHQQTQATSSISGYGSSKLTSSSLQNLLTSPRGSYAPTQQQQQQQQHTSNNNNDGADTRVVMGSPKINHTNKSGIMATMATANTPTTIVTTTTTTPSSPTSHSTFHATQMPPIASNNNNNNNNNSNFGDGELLTNEVIGGNIAGVTCKNGVGSGVIQDLLVVMGSSSALSSDHLETHAAASTPGSTSLSLSNQNSVQNHSSSSNSNSNNINNSNNNNNLGNISGNGSNNNNNNNGGNGSNNNNTLLTHDTTGGDRRDPSPYRCGHCHQVSNWKHVIQVLLTKKKQNIICIRIL